MVKWDLEQDETTMSLDKVTYEGEGIPLQQVEPQGTSVEAADTHTLLIEIIWKTSLLTVLAQSNPHPAHCL